MLSQLLRLRHTNRCILQDYNYTIQCIRSQHTHTQQSIHNSGNDVNPLSHINELARQHRISSNPPVQHKLPNPYAIDTLRIHDEELKSYIQLCTDNDIKKLIIEQITNENITRDTAQKLFAAALKTVSNIGRGSNLSISHQLFLHWYTGVRNSLNAYIEKIVYRQQLAVKKHEHDMNHSTDTTDQPSHTSTSHPSAVYESIIQQNRSKDNEIDSNDPEFDPYIDYENGDNTEHDNNGDHDIDTDDTTTRYRGSYTRVTDIYFYEMRHLIDTIATASIIEVLNQLLKTRVYSVIDLASNIGKLTRNEIKSHAESVFHKKVKDTENELNKYKRSQQESTDQSLNMNEISANIIKLEHQLKLLWRDERPLIHDQHSHWGDANHVRVGCILIKFILQNCMIPPYIISKMKSHSNEAVSKSNLLCTHKSNNHRVYAIIHDKTQKSVKRKYHLQGQIRMIDPLYLYLTELNDNDTTVVDARFKPMLVRPKPWTSYDTGGYLTINKRVMRTKGSRLQLEALRTAELDKLYSALNYLADTPWQVNKYVYNIVIELKKRGGNVAGMPSYTDIPLPIRPSDSTTDQNITKVFKTQLERCKQMNRDLNSQRADLNVRIKQAGEFIDRLFYCPQNIDFRGRIYPIPSHLNHQGPDIARGLLLYGTGKPITSDGIRWLKIHVANLYGKNKLSLADRVKWTESNMHDIMNSVDNPLYKSNELELYYWCHAEEPFQFLAAAYELVQCVRSPVPEQYISYLPVHVDGSCNGLQHYAAMGLDYLGGSKVNLTPADIPQDVYQGVCDRVNEKLKLAADQGDKRALVLYGHINRKIVKQTVMTTVYGVTALGARDQVRARLEERTDIEFNGSYGTDERYVALNTHAGYISKLTMDALTDLFTGARSIMDWLIQCSTLITSTNQTVSWITPLNLPVVQPYRQIQTYQVKTALQKISIADKSDFLPINRREQRGALPPNFVHSLDATHALLTTLACKKHDITFAAVHDSYWTHASTMTRLNELLREEFVNLYSQPILHDLRNQWSVRFPYIEFPPIPQVRNTKKLDLRDVLKSTYFFS